LASSAWCAATLIASGVEKSGSPAPKSNHLDAGAAEAVDGGRLSWWGDPDTEVRSASFMRSSASPFSLRRCSTSLGHSPARARRGANTFLDEARADVGVLLRRHHEHGFDLRLETLVQSAPSGLELEVRHRPQPADDDLRLFALDRNPPAAVEGVDLALGWVLNTSRAIPPAPAS